MMRGSQRRLRDESLLRRRNLHKMLWSIELFESSSRCQVCLPCLKIYFMVQHRNDTGQIKCEIFVIIINSVFVFVFVFVFVDLYVTLDKWQIRRHAYPYIFIIKAKQKIRLTNLESLGKHVVSLKCRII